MNEGPGNGTSLSMRTLRGELGRRAPILGTLKDMKRKAQEPSISLHMGPVGKLDGEFLAGGL